MQAEFAVHRRVHSSSVANPLRAVISLPGQTPTRLEYRGETCTCVKCTFLFQLKNCESEKKLHKALRSVQFVASFTSFYFELLSYLACGEKIIRLASKNSVKLDEKSTSDF